MSVFSNHCNVTCYGDVTRLVFEDCVSGSGLVQANIVMRTADAEALAQCLQEVFDRLKIAQEAPKAPTSG